MVWPFDKKKILDLTKNVPKNTGISVDDEYKDLTSSQDSASALGFLGNLATASSSDSGDLDLKHLKVKLEDMEYKFENMRKKLDATLDRLDLAEKKIDRNLRNQ